MLKERSKDELYEVDERKREFDVAPKEEERDLGPLSLLPGLWRNDAENTSSRTFGRGWNLIALPFRGENRPPYRLLMNQYNEEIRFTFVDDMVPNRGVRFGQDPANTDQFIVTIDYQQTIRQIAAEDDAKTPLAGTPNLPIHHEPGLFLHMLNERTDGIDVARLATIPHGNAATALGKSRTYAGPPQDIDMTSGFPEGATVDGGDIDAAVDSADTNPDNAYLLPYKHFTDEPFPGVVGVPIFSAKTPFDTLKGALGAFDVKQTTELRMDTAMQDAGIVNIPFIERQADANFMRSVFYIMELNETDADGKTRLALAYTQFIFLDFFRRRDGQEGLIRWPHISINVMEKVAEPTRDDPYMVKYSKY